MTVKQIIEELKKHPEYINVFIDERVTDFTYGLANSVNVKEINFMEEPTGDVLSRDKVIVISEE